MSGPLDPIDKSSWPAGPWHDEPDRREWRHAGFPCLIVRVPIHGALCGYVAVPPGHPWHGRDYDAVEADVHWGLSYAGPCGGLVCRTPGAGEPDDVWWLGFDHAHAWDLSPAVLRFFPSPPGGEVYRDFGYATAGVESLAAQAAAAGKEPYPLPVKGGVRWFEHPERREPGDLHPDLFVLLTGGTIGGGGPEYHWRDYPARGDAVADLTAAARRKRDQ